METALPSIPVNMLYAQQLHYLLFIIISVKKLQVLLHIYSQQKGEIFKNTTKENGFSLTLICTGSPKENLLV